MRKQQNEMIYLKNKNRDGRHDVESQEGEKDNAHYDLPLIEKEFIHHLFNIVYSLSVLGLLSLYFGIFESKFISLVT